MFTHARCGGVLIPIDHRKSPARNYVQIVARCNRCGLPGEVVQKRRPELERWRLWAGLVPK